ncbi:hypothetical protein P1J78_15230 [Psychromarinibacter sp. C21-152]|uniref:Uncharacterized protein n=1 Tax=Psychromarinibacter sediminicola TaxID=3033385 RepID=A0AAE3T9E1_9RHOB|nr:hypothetical protein [Psychromarinibacter sediminicola]MDF0602092.1 hypothetical protein [Psychromarinibacter sediminicola]
MKFVKAPDNSADWPFALFGGGTIQLVVLAVVALFLAGLTLRLLRGRRGGTACRWKRDPRARDTLVRWQCAACGVDAFTSDGRRPKECKRHMREARL